MGAHVPDHLAENRRTGAFERRAAGALDGVVPPTEQLVVACSGGPDSTAALVAVARTRGAASVSAAYFDHRMRAPTEIADDRRFLDALTQRLGVPLLCGRAGAPIGDEATAREQRYRWLAGASRNTGATSVVTGHTLQDQAETVLLRLVRGTGTGGAAGMQLAAPWPVEPSTTRPDAADAGDALPRLLRPLLEIARDDVMGYLDALGVRARCDSSNESLAYSRNRVRHRVLPELRVVNPRAVQQIAAFARQAREDDEALTAWAERGLTDHAAIEGREARLDRAAFGALPAAVASRMLRLAAERVGLALERPQIAQLRRIARSRGSHMALTGGRAWVDAESLHLRREEAQA